MRKKNFSSKPEKVNCEVCGCNDKCTLHYHHIIPRTDLNCTHSWENICVLCANCHSKTHLGTLRIIGVFPGTRPPTGRVLIYELDGVKNIDVDEAYYTPKPKEMKVHYGPETSGTDGGEQTGDH